MSAASDARGQGADPIDEAEAAIWAELTRYKVTDRLPPRMCAALAQSLRSIVAEHATIAAGRARLAVATAEGRPA